MRARILTNQLVALLLAVAAGVGAATPATASSSGPLQLPPVDSIPDAPAGDLDPAADGVQPPAPELEQPQPVAPQPNVLGPSRVLQERREQLTRRQVVLRDKLLAAEERYELAAGEFERLDEQLAERLIRLLEQEAFTRIDALVMARDADPTNPDANVLAQLHPAERLLLRERAAAATRQEQRRIAADTARRRLHAVHASIAAIDAALAQRRTAARALAGDTAIDTDLVFTTGPIPEIGYWGALAGGSALEGWMGYVGAALGGVGCAPPSPDLRASDSIESGIASWYGPGFHGNPTANGEVFDQDELTAAHPTLPFGTIVRVTSARSGRCVFVRINDRGPFVAGRIIDLSRAAAQAIDMSGTDAVQVETWQPGVPAAA